MIAPFTVVGQRPLRAHLERLAQCALGVRVSAEEILILAQFAFAEVNAVVLIAFLGSSLRLDTLHEAEALLQIASSGRRITLAHRDPRLSILEQAFAKRRDRTRRG